MIAIHGSSTIQYEDIPCGDGDDEFWRATHLVAVEDVLAGDIFIILADHKYKNDNAFWVELTSLITIDTDTPNSGAEQDYNSSPSHVGGVERSSVMGQNFHHDYGHYIAVSRHLVWTADQNYPELIFGLRARARTSESGGPYEVNANYPNTPPQGQIQVIQVRE